MHPPQTASRGLARARRFLPGLEGASRATLLPDLLAGLAVAAIAVPQGMAYALVAGVPIEMGIWAAALPCVVGALLSSSPYLVTGPTNPVSLVLGLSVVGPVVAAGGAVPIETVLAISLAAGALLAGFGVLGLGRASRFLSDPVICGLAIGVGILIALTQLPAAAGSEPGVRVTPSLLPTAWPILESGVRALAGIDARSAALAAGVPLAVLALRRLGPRLPGALIALGAAAGAAWLLGWATGPDAVRTLDAAAVTWPVLHVPRPFDPATVGPPALAIALLVTVQSTAAARTLALVSEGPKLDPDRELFAQGAANVTAALVGAIPTSGSFTRSALARSAGGRSRVAPLASGAAVLALLPVLGEVIVHVPLSALAGLVILSGLDLINVGSIRRAAATRGDAAVLAVTLGATMWLDVVQAIYVGLFLSLALLVRRGGRLQIVEIVRAGGQRLREIGLDAHTGSTPAVLLHVEGDLNFAVAQELADRLEEVGSRGPEVIVVRVKRALHIDATVIEALRRVAEELRAEGITLILCGLTDRMAALLERTELADALGPEGLLRAGPRLMEGFERALHRTRTLLEPRGDDAIFRGEESGAWSYEI